jgi:hypothetical protein
LFSKSQLLKKKKTGMRCVSCTFYPTVVPASVVDTPEPEEDPRKKLMENWKDLSELLGQSIAFLYQRFNAGEMQEENGSSHLQAFMREAQ